MIARFVGGPSNGKTMAIEDWKRPIVTAYSLGTARFRIGQPLDLSGVSYNTTIYVVRRGWQGYPVHNDQLEILFDWSGK